MPGALGPTSGRANARHVAAGYPLQLATESPGTVSPGLPSAEYFIAWKVCDIELVKVTREDKMNHPRAFRAPSPAHYDNTSVKFLSPSLTMKPRVCSAH